jgi:uncharacterized membrane-anchored protein
MPDLLDDDDFVGPDKSRSRSRGALAWERAVAWLAAHERLVFVAAAAFQFLVLSSMIVGQVVPFQGAGVVLLRVTPVDPRDLLRGDYVTLGYEISQVAPGEIAGLPAGSTWSGNAADWQGRTVYVTLEPEPDGMHFRKEKVSIDPPPPGTRFIRGTLIAPFRISFGIESYFVQEGTGHDYEDAIREHRLSAEVALASDGRASLRGLRIE